MDITSILSQDAHWNVNKHLAKQIGLVPTILLMELIFCRKKYKEEQFYESAAKLEENLCIGEDLRRSATKVLVDKDLISTERKGTPARWYYRLNEPEILKLLSATSDLESPPLETGKPATSDRVPPVTINKNEIKNINKEEREREEPLPQKVKTPEDPFDPVPFHLQPKITNDGWNYNEEGANLVINFFEDYYQREFKMSSGRIKERKMEASKLYNYLSQEDKIAELKEIILQFEYSWHGHKCILPKKADSPFKATPAKIIELWEKLSPTNVPHWIREGHTTEREWKNARSQQQEAEKEKARQQRTTSQSVEIYDPNTDPAMIAALEDFGSLLVKGVRND